MISDKMVEWLDENVVTDGYCLHGMENITGIDWRLRFQDFNDRNLKTYIEKSNERRAAFIIADLSEKAKDAGSTLISRHLNGFKDEDEYQSWIKDLQDMAKKVS